jgi:spore photoproduct lyase
MLTKSDNVDDILDLPHNRHTIIAWSLTNDLVSKKCEIGTPSLERRLLAARQVRQEEYRVSIRLDPIIPFQGWKEEYANTIKRVFDQIFPKNITIGTLRFAEGFYKMRKTTFRKDSDLPKFVEGMEPMFSPKASRAIRGPNPGSTASGKKRGPRSSASWSKRSGSILIPLSLSARNQQAFGIE